MIKGQETSAADEAYLKEEEDEGREIKNGPDTGLCKPG